MEFSTASISKPGGRESNQDRCAFVSLDNGACWVLADGLGGHGGGEVASDTAVRSMLDGFNRNRECSSGAIRELLRSANRELQRCQAADPRLTQMRTTAVVLCSDFSIACWGHIGDSRLYLFHDGAIAFQTRDHSVPQSLVNAGKIAAEEVRFHPDRNRVLKALGSGAELEPTVELHPVRVAAGDAFLICTDGFWEYVTEIEMAADWACSQRPDDWLARMERRLWRKAPPDHDNYSAIAISVDR